MDTRSTSITPPTFSVTAARTSSGGAPRATQSRHPPQRRLLVGETRTMTSLIPERFSYPLASRSAAAMKPPVMEDA
jgi:hypothetical protein